MKKGLSVVRWIAVAGLAMFAISALSTGAFFGAVCFVISGVLIMPVKPIQKLRSKFKLKKTVSIILAVLLAFAGAVSVGMSVENETADDVVLGEETDISGLPDESDWFDDGIDSEESTTENKTTTDTANTQDNNESSGRNTEASGKAPVGTGSASTVKISNIPAYSGKAYVVINNNQPNFSSSELTTVGYEKYSSLDSLGRCGVALASCGEEIMPADGEERGSISSIKPSGWVQAKYSNVSGGYLYNRCHLIGWQLSAENANNKNLITGTRYMNTEGMLPFENMVADYINETGNHVAYRITPVYDGNNLVASGVQMEAYSVEDDGEGICFNVYCYNVQPGVKINYATGASSADGSSAAETTKAASKASTTTTKASSGTTKSSTVTTTKKQASTTTTKSQSSYNYILNTSSKKFHYSWCGSVKQMSDKNKSEYSGSRDDLISMGYTPCGNCDP